MTKRLFTLFSIIATACLFLSVGTSFAQTSYGNAGLFVHPTAEISSEQKLRVNLSYLNVPTSSNNSESHWIPINLNYSLNRRAEIGATYITRILRGEGRGSAGLFGKYLLLEETKTDPQLLLSEIS